MKVKELIKKLEQCNQEADVLAFYDSAPRMSVDNIGVSKYSEDGLNIVLMSRDDYEYSAIGKCNDMDVLASLSK